MHYKIQPWKHQLDAIERFRHQTHGALFMEQGVGKTLTFVNLMRHKYEAQGFVVPTLVLCPAIVVENWRREWLMHSDLKEHEIVTLTGTGANRQDTFMKAVAVWPHKVVITNYEALLMKGLHPLLKKWARALILDESQKCKDISTKRTKLTLEISKNCVYRFIGSGTPVVNSLFDIFSQFLIMDHGATFGEKLISFKNRYFVDMNSNRPRHCYFPDWRPKGGAVREINAEIFKSAIRVKKSECLDLPPLVRQIVDFELQDEQARFYRSMEQESIAYFDIGERKGSPVSADLAIKRALRLQQVTSGFVTDDSGATRIFEKNPRTQVLKEVIESIPPTAKIIIWAVFKQNYRDVRSVLEEMGISYTEIHGEVAAEDRQNNVDSFNRANGGVRVILGHPGSGGIGINLVSASYSIFFTRGFSLENDLQAEARNHRGGSEIHKCITRIDIVAKGTIDEVVLCALRDKNDVQEAVLNHMRGSSRRD